MKTLAKILGVSLGTLWKLFVFIFELVEAHLFLSGDKSKPAYSASFASHGTLLKKRHTGFCLDGRRRLSAKNSVRNAMIVGGTGTGKSSVALLPSLYSMQGSFVVHDPSQELYALSAGYLARKGYTIKLLNFADPIHSDGYNPLFRIETSSDVNKVAAMIIRSSLGSKGDQFWNLQAISLLRVLIMLVKTFDPSYQTLANVRHLLMGIGANPSKVLSYIQNSGNKSLKIEFQSFLSFDDKVKAGVVASCLSALQLFSDEKVAEVTSYDSIPLPSFRERPVALFIQNPVAEQAYYSVLSALFLEQLFASVLKKVPVEKAQPIWFLLDEAASLHLPSLATVISNNRKYKAGLLLALQSSSQLKETYGRFDAETITSNCYAQLYFTGQGLATAKDLEQLVGKRSIEDDAGTVVRPLLTHDEIRTLPRDQGILICGNYKPMKIKLHPYYKSFRYRRHSRLSTPWRGPKQRPTAPLIPLSVTSQSHHV